MKKIILFVFLAFNLNAESNYHGKIVDEAQGDKIFGENLPTDSNRAFADPLVIKGSNCPDSNANCTNFYERVMQIFEKRVDTNLKWHKDRWKQTNDELKNQMRILSNLPKTQIELLAIEQAKLNKLKELRFELEKQTRLAETNGESLKAKSFIND